VFGSEDAVRLRRVLEEPLADELTRAQALRFGALLHDIGKPATRATRPDGRITFIGHDRLGERMIRSLCRRLRTSDRLARFLEGLTRHHLVLGFLVHERPLDRRQIYRYLARTTPVEVEVTLLSCADRIATRGRRADEATVAHLDLARELMHAALDWREHGPPKLPIRGDELAREIGIEPGPELGRLLAELTEAAYAGEVTTREDAVAAGRRLTA
jgi:poly(A) polymerase